MPYIKQEDRKFLELNLEIKSFLDKLEERRFNLNAGWCNYLISSIVWFLFDIDKTYRNANQLLGVLEAVKLEFYRRKVAPYEDEKIEENGDILND